MKKILAILLLLAMMAMPALAEAELVYRTDDVELHLPAAWAGKVLVLPALNGAAFYQKASYDRYLEEEGIAGGGYLFALGGSVDSSFEGLPSFIYLGFCEDSAMNYYLDLPTDYPAYMDDDEIRTEWDHMHDMIRGIAQGAVIRGSAPGTAAGTDGMRYAGLDPWGNPLAVTIDAIRGDSMDWTYTEDFAGQILVQSFEGTELVDGHAAFHIEAAVQDAEHITCDYSGTMTVENDALTITFEAGEMTEASSEGGSTAYHVEALEKADRTVVLTNGAPAEPEVVTSGDYDYTVNGDTATIVLYHGEGKDVEIPAEIDGYPVTGVGDKAFRDKKLNSLSVPDGVLTIGKQAFEYCLLPGGLRLPENVTISEDAFSYAKLPAALAIPAGATVEKGAFAYVKTLEQVTIGPEATIKGRAFGYCDNLEQVVCAGYLEKEAFEYCKKMKQAFIQGEMDEEAFSYCGDVEVTSRVVEDGNGLG
ncbi:MAG: leucine-rich repeat domain-containing protein [Clostridia bacterium]|nr:leucine-rich repeat domain-containing protein [Clostridia bacterium]